jgi:hypothetical protein
MPKRSAVFEGLPKALLVDLAAHFDVAVDTKTTKARIAELLTGSRKIKLDEALARLTLAELKSLCATLDVEATGRKGELIERLGGDKPKAEKAKPKQRPKVPKLVEVAEAHATEPEEKAPEHDTAARPHYKDRVVPKELQSPEPRGCAYCKKKVPLKKCQVHNCPHVFPEAVAWKICSECLFERGGLSFEEFGERHRNEAACPHCNKTWASRSKTA